MLTKHPTATTVIALTGGVASGKTRVARQFELLGAHVYDADTAAREAVALGSPGLIQTVAIFGKSVLDETGQLDRRAMRDRIFNDPTAKHKLEKIIHPLVMEWFRKRVENEHGPYCLLAIPLLAENISHYRWIKHVLLVDAPESLQLSRLMLRDGIDEPLARRMLAQQASRAERLALADYVIDNSGDETSLGIAVAELHRTFLALSEKYRIAPDRR